MSDTPTSVPPTSAWRFFVVLVLVLGAVGFGLASLCGAAFTVSGLLDDGPYAGAALVIAVPSLLIGVPLCWLCVRALRRRLAASQAARR
jgi:hypothetical protein